MKKIQKIIAFIFLFLTVTACSTKKNTIVSRSWQSLNTKYNVLFNGKESFAKGIEEIHKKYKDDWFNQLPIEPIKFEEDKISVRQLNSRLGSGFGASKNNEQKSSTPFGIAEAKAVKAIQKHGMNFDGEEHNSQIDDAYLLLGKARYYDQRFIPSIEAFNYIISSYPFASLINETKIWRAKANVRIDNEEFAIESMELLLQVKNSKEVDLPPKIKEQGYTTLAMAYVKSDSLQKAKKYLMKATETMSNRAQGTRNLFVLGQIYGSENKKDSASFFFNKIINFDKAPYKYKIHAHIELSKNAVDDSTATVRVEKMLELIKDRENRPYLAELYYHVGFLSEQKGQVNLATDYYQKSLRVKSGSIKQKTFSYERLADINFKNSQYKIANSYYDTILKISTDTLNLRFRRIKRKHKNFASLIGFENIVTKNDSIIKMASLSKEAQEAYFQKYIDNLKENDEKAAQLKLNQQAFGASFGQSSLQSNSKGKWYFYNSQSLSFGKSEFEKNWGKRKLGDNWRWSSQIELTSKKKNAVSANQKNKRYDLASYLKKIPSDPKVIDALKMNRNEALYELGLIYKEQFKDTKLAIERLERVDSLAPAEELILPINWHLYKIYALLGQELKTTKHKNIILEKYPDTKFAQVIRNPEKPLLEITPTSEIEELYKEIYHLYKDDNFEETVSKINELIPTLQNSKLIPKFELLKAYATGKYKNKEAFKIALDFVVVSHGGTEEGKRAKEILKQLDK